MLSVKKTIKTKQQLLTELKNYQINKINYIESVSRNDLYKLNQTINQSTHYNSIFDVIVIEKRI